MMYTVIYVMANQKLLRFGVNYIFQNLGHLLKIRFTKFHFFKEVKWK